MHDPVLSPDLVLVARRIHLLGDAAPVQAVLVRAGRIAAAGAEDDVRRLALPGARLERLPHAVVTPGITDAHTHPTAWALSRRRVELHDARTLGEGLERVRAAASAGEGWIRGLGWDLHRWGGLPDRGALDAVAPGRPVYLQSHDIHAAWLSTAALRLCGIGRDTPDPDGGEIVRGEDGEPTGILKETAMRLAEAHLPEPGEAEVQDALADAQRALHAWGVTGVHSVEPTGLEDFERMRAAGGLRLRVLQAISLPRLDAAIASGLRSGFGGEWIRIGGVKMFLDGALGSRTAWLREPYEGTPDERGISTLPPDEFRAAAERASAAGISCTVHAIGDAAVDLALDVLSAVPAPAAMPHRIEHLQLCAPDRWERAARSGIVASMQPVHLLSDIPAADRHWGTERSRGAYAFAPLLRGGMTLAFGSDVPVETADPRPGLYAGRKRTTWDGDPAEGWWPEHALSAEEALRAYTEGPAAASGESGRRGRLLPGYDADLAAWDVDPLEATPEEVRGMRCVLTMVGGEVVHRG